RMISIPAWLSLIMSQRFFQALTAIRCLLTRIVGKSCKRSSIERTGKSKGTETVMVRWLAVHRQSRAGIAAAMAARDCLWQHPVQVSHRTHTTDNGGSLAIF